MRFSVAALALCVSLLAYAAAGMAVRASTPPPAPAPADSADAAAKHAKLTECLKAAKDRKLVGAAKTAFVKECTSKP